MKAFVYKVALCSFLNIRTIAFEMAISELILISDSVKKHIHLSFLERFRPRRHLLLVLPDSMNESRSAETIGDSFVTKALIYPGGEGIFVLGTNNHVNYRC